MNITLTAAIVVGGKPVLGKIYHVVLEREQVLHENMILLKWSSVAVPVTPAYVKQGGDDGHVVSKRQSGLARLSL